MQYAFVGPSVRTPGIVSDALIVRICHRPVKNWRSFCATSRSHFCQNCRGGVYGEGEGGKGQGGDRGGEGGVGINHESSGKNSLASIGTNRKSE